MERVMKNRSAAIVTIPTVELTFDRRENNPNGRTLFMDVSTVDHRIIIRLRDAATYPDDPVLNASDITPYFPVAARTRPRLDGPTTSTPTTTHTARPCARPASPPGGSITSCPTPSRCRPAHPWRSRSVGRPNSHARQRHPRPAEFHGRAHSDGAVRPTGGPHHRCAPTAPPDRPRRGSPGGPGRATLASRRSPPHPLLERSGHPTV